MVVEEKTLQVRQVRASEARISLEGMRWKGEFDDLRQGFQLQRAFCAGALSEATFADGEMEKVSEIYGEE